MDHPPQPSPRITLEAVFARASRFAREGKVEQALSLFQAIAEKWPDIGVVHANIAALALRLDKPETALEALKAAARLEPHLPERHGELASALHANGWMRDAFNSFKRQLLLVPEAADPLYNVAITSQLIRSRQMARDWLRRGTRLTVSSVNCWSRLARTEARLGNREAAERARKRALALKPDDRDAIHDASFATLALPQLQRSFCVGFETSEDEIKRANTLKLAMVEALLDAGDEKRARDFFDTHLADQEVTDKFVRLARRLNAPGHQALQTEYERWISLYDVHDDAAIATTIAAWNAPPAIDIVMPVCDPPPDILREAITSVTAQSYANWSLLIADDCSSDPEVHAVLDEVEKHDRIRVARRTTRGHISEASNSALALGTAPWVTFLDHDDLLHRHALYYLAEKLQKTPELDMIFTDEDQISPTGARFNPILKPSWDEDAILAQNYLNHITLHRRALVEQVGGFRKGYEGSQDHDLILRVSRLTGPERIAHIPRILYHWRAIPGSAASDADAKPYAIKARLKAVRDHMAVIEPDSQVSLIEGACRVVRPLPSPRPKVSVIIPTKDGLALLQRCVTGLLQDTDWPALELIVVDNGSEQESTKAYLRALEDAGQATIVSAPGPFNYSALVNSGARAATSDILVFLNNDIEVIEADWLAELVSHAVRAEVGVVGAKLLYPDFKVQHAGIFLSPDFVAFHGHAGISAQAPGHLNRARIVQNVAAVTGACQAIRRDIFFQIGGYDAEHLAVDFSDIDLCLRANERGYRTIWTPFARLIHHESASRGAYLSQEKRARHASEFQVMKERWAHLLEDDPSYNPNLQAGPNRDSFRLAFPPRRIR